MDPAEDILTKPLPAFRSDLEVYRGPVEGDGSPSYNIYDPMRSIYFKVSWAEVAILQHLKAGMTIKDLLQILNKETTLRVSVEELASFIMQLESQGLLEGYKDPRKLFAQAQRERPGWFKWLMFNYLFIKIPLFNPNRFLERTIQYAEPFMTKWAFALYAFLSIWGLGLVLTRWSEFVNTFPYFFNVGGIFAYSVVIIFTKLIHEFSHAYVAKKYGLRIPTMGLAFLVLWPVLYTDATDAWRLHNRNQRLLISAAGVIAECVLAGLATIIWAFSSPGILQSLCFVVASVNWIATLVINLNPALRFDGYYILSDLLGVENLQSRAFMLLRYSFYRTVAGAELPDTEPKMTSVRKQLLILYAIYTWAYRIFLYTAIALFVYYKFTKAIGVFLFAAEIGIFFIWPIVDEFQFYQKIKKVIKWNLRLKLTTIALFVFLIWFIIPWPVWVKMPAITVPSKDQIVYAPNAGRVEKLYVDRGSVVARGDPILWIESEELQNKIDVLDKESQVINRQLAITQLTDENLPYYMEQQLKLAQTQAELEGYRKQKEQNLVTAKFDGYVYQWDDYLHEGLPVNINQTLAKIAPQKDVDVLAFVNEEEATYIDVGDWLVFSPRESGESFDAKVASVSPVRTSILRQTQLASVFSGDLPVTQGANNQLKMVDTYYAIDLKLEDKAGLRLGRTGYVEFWGPWRSRALLLVEYIISLVVSESGF